MQDPYGGGGDSWGGPKGGGKEELGEEEWVTFNSLNLKKTKIWQDYSTSLKFKREEERGFLCALKWRRGEFI